MVTPWHGSSAGAQQVCPIPSVFGSTPTSPSEPRQSGERDAWVDVPYEVVRRRAAAWRRERFCSPATTPATSPTWTSVTPTPPRPRPRENWPWPSPSPSAIARCAAAAPAFALSQPLGAARPPVVTTPPTVRARTRPGWAAAAVDEKEERAADSAGDEDDARETADCPEHGSLPTHDSAPPASRGCAGDPLTPHRAARPPAAVVRPTPRTCPTWNASQFQCRPRCTPMPASMVFAATEWISRHARCGVAGRPNVAETCFEISRPLRTVAVSATNSKASTAQLSREPRAGVETPAA